ncbi:MAG TPA: divalent-cation tolerance protein CutA [Vicinamibacteria bacterium]|nr:divalent-cation tolerance protein CutA [Vicinamibacteria bacterium]
MTTPVVVLSAIGAQPEAQQIARTLVDERLAACVNIVPGVTSVYRWKGAVEQEPELLLVIKTVAERVDALKARLVELHPYELPEVVVLPIGGGHAPYLAWIEQQVSPLP